MANVIRHLEIQEEIRVSNLIKVIEELYGHLAPDEVDILAVSYNSSYTGMIEVMRTGPRCSTFADLMDDVEYHPVHLPQELNLLLRPRDVLLVTLGLKNKTWHLLHSGPPYQTEYMWDWA